MESILSKLGKDSTEKFNTIAVKELAIRKTGILGN